MLAKQSWRLLKDPDSLSAKLLKAVYFPDRDFLDAEVGAHPSQVWRAICAGTEILKQGIVKRIGNGQTTSIWNQNWIPRDYMLRALHPRSQNPPEMVSQLIIQEERCWDCHKLREHMQEPDVRIILNIPLSAINFADAWAWHYERTGQFTVRSAYRLLSETRRRREDWLTGRSENSDKVEYKGQWRRLWKLKIPGKLKNFAWRLAKNSVPTEALRHHRNMVDNDVCPICNSAVDSWRHALVECTMAKCVWSLIDEDLVEHMIACSHDDARLWLIELQDSMNNEEFVKVLVTLWSIWWVRRKAIHEERFQSPLTTLSFITSYLGDLAAAATKQQGRKHVSQEGPKWIPPPAGYVKIHVDAAVGSGGSTRGASRGSSPPSKNWNFFY